MTNTFRLGRGGTFWSAAAVLMLCLWSSGAPSVLYPLYAAQWHLPQVVITSVFGAYPLALLVVLLFFGGLSDGIGRRRAMLLGIVFIGLSSVVFALAPNVGFLFAGRVMQGIGTGIALGAASAALVENNTSGNARFPSSLATISTSTGLALAVFLSGLLAQLAPLPLVLSFAVLFLLSAAAYALTWMTPDDAGTGRPRWKPQGLHLPGGILRVFIVSTLSVSVAYSCGAIFLSLGAQMARQLTGTTNLLVIGAVLSTSAVSIGVTALFLSRVHAHLAVVAGGIVSMVALALMAVAATTGSLAVLLLWCVVGGIGYSFAFTGGLSLINRTAPAPHRGATLSLLYLFAYLLQAATAIGAGQLATSLGLDRAMELVAPLVGFLCVAAIVLAVVDLLARRRIAREAAPVLA
jgi:MFS family permease